MLEINEGEKEPQFLGTRHLGSENQTLNCGLENEPEGGETLRLAYQGLGRKKASGAKSCGDFENPC
jgi:hypothetical protein